MKCAKKLVNTLYTKIVKSGISKKEKRNKTKIPSYVSQKNIIHYLFFRFDCFFFCSALTYSYLYIYRCACFVTTMRSFRFVTISNSFRLYAFITVNCPKINSFKHTGTAFYFCQCFFFSIFLSAFAKTFTGDRGVNWKTIVKLNNRR